MSVLLYLGLVACCLLLVIAWLVRHSSDPRNLNALSHWAFRLTSGWGSCPDTTVGAYARQVHEHARENDDRFEEDMTGITLEQFQRTDVQTETHTEEPGP